MESKGLGIARQIVLRHAPSRLAALGVVLLIAMHLIGQHIWLDESPVWFNGIFLPRLILFDGARDVPFWAIGLGFAAAAALLAWLL